MQVDTVIYHDSCADGWCAAWLFARAYPGVELIPAQYGQAPPDVGGKTVVIADFSYTRGVMLELMSQARSLVVLDHHKTAEDELAGLAGCTFDLTKSGGRLAWEWLWDAGKIGNTLDTYGVAYFRDAPHWLVRYTEDRDLWRWALPDSRAVNAALRSYPRTVADWDRLALTRPAALKPEGEAILRVEREVAAYHVRRATEIEILGHKVLCVNATTLQSEIAGELAAGRPFGVCYFELGGKRVYSLRSVHGVDVSEIAKAYGGGGHPAAAGFEVPVGFTVEDPWGAAK